MRLVAVKRNKPYPEAAATYLEWQLWDVPAPKKEGEVLIAKITEQMEGTNAG